LTAEKMALMIKIRMNNPMDLAKTAANAKLAGKLEATSLLADMVEAIADGKTIQEFKELHA
jgi:UDP-N-acetylglucosamine--N-acetylmuramyl-(pentapeptide) pyrophosphoryl-undecaprenol N-acetylglucosamine transferase